MVLYKLMIIKYDYTQPAQDRRKFGHWSVILKYAATFAGDALIAELLWALDRGHLTACPIKQL